MLWSKYWTGAIKIPRPRLIRRISSSRTLIRASPQAVSCISGNRLNIVQSCDLDTTSSELDVVIYLLRIKARKKVLRPDNDGKLSVSHHQLMTKSIMYQKPEQPFFHCCSLPYIPVIGLLGLSSYKAARRYRPCAAKCVS